MACSLLSPSTCAMNPGVPKIFRTPGLMAHVLGDNKLHAIAASRCY